MFVFNNDKFHWIRFHGRYIFSMTYVLWSSFPALATLGPLTTSWQRLMMFGSWWHSVVHSLFRGRRVALWANPVAGNSSIPNQPRALVTDCKYPGNGSSCGSGDNSWTVDELTALDPGLCKGYIQILLNNRWDFSDCWSNISPFCRLTPPLEYFQAWIYVTEFMILTLQMNKSHCQDDTGL